VAKEKKPAAPKPPKSVEELVQHALKTAATKPKANWTGTTAAALFNTKEANHEAAIAECTKTESPLLKQVGKAGVMTAAGFERIAGNLPAEEARTAYDQLREALPDDQIGVVARAMAGRLTPGERVEFIQGVIRRTPLAATELTPLLEEAVAAEKAEHEKRIAEALKRKQTEEASRKALERAIQLLDDRRRSRIDALRRELEAEGERVEEVNLPLRVETHSADAKAQPTTVAEKDFRRDVAAQLAASWRATWELNKPETREFLESAMWNISGLRLVGEPEQRVAFSGRIHESVAGVFPNDTVRIVRPGWVLDEENGEFIVLKAVVQK